MPEPKLKRRKTSSDEQPTQSDTLGTEFGVKFNTDITLLWKWALTKSPKDPLKSATKPLKLTLCGPFRYLLERHESKENKGRKGDVVELHMLDRDWQCPPEFQPCVHNDTQLFGLWRDIPSEKPDFVVRKEKDSGVITPVATDLFDLMRVLAKKQKVDLPQDLMRFVDSYGSTQTLKQLEAKRRKSVVAKTFNQIGIAVPVSSNEVGYRPLTVTYSELDTMLTRCSKTDDEDKKDKILGPFDECINYIQFANDECDYGMGFELGMCVFSHPASKHFMGTISTLLPLAYELLGRHLYAKIMKRICEDEDKRQGN